MIVGKVFGLQNDCPSCREDAAMNIELIRLEEEAPEDWQYRQILTIW